MCADERVEIREIARKLEQDKRYTIVGHTNAGLPFQHPIIARKIEVIRGHSRITGKPIETLRIVAEHPGNKEVVRYTRFGRMWDVTNVVPDEYRLDDEHEGGFMIFEDWHPESTIIKIPYLIYKSAAVYKKNLPMTAIFEQMHLFDEKCLEVAKEKIGVEPIVTYTVERGWSAWERFNPPMYQCRYGCSFQTVLRDSLNQHEARHCKMRMNACRRHSTPQSDAMLRS